MKQLIEVAFLKNMIQAIGKSFTHSEVEPKVKAEQEKLTKEILKVILDAHGIKSHSNQEEKDEHTFVKEYDLTIGHDKYILKASLIYGHANLSVTLWNDKNDLLDVIIVGDLKDKYKLRSLGKSRLEKWSKQ